MERQFVKDPALEAITIGTYGQATSAGGAVRKSISPYTLVWEFQVPNKNACLAYPCYGYQQMGKGNICPHPHSFSNGG